MVDEFHYKISEKDHLAFWKLVSNAHYRKIVPWLLALVFAYSAWKWIDDGLMMAVLVAVFAIIGGAIAGKAAELILLPYQSNKAFRDNALLQEDMKMVISDDSLNISQSSGGLNFKWSDAKKWDENDRVFAIFPAGNLGYILPKQSVPSSAVDAVRARLMKSGLAEKGKWRK